LCADLGVRTQHDDGGDVLAKSPMGDGENGGFGHIGMAQQRLLDLRGRDLLPAPVDHVLDAANNEEISVPVEVSQVAGSEPAVAKRGIGGGDIIVISPRDGGTS